MKESWREYVKTKKVSENVRNVILESWRRCEKMGVNYMRGRGTRVSDAWLKESISRKTELINLTRPILENVYSMVKSTSYSVVLTDEKGVIIDLIINNDIKDIHDNLNFVKGSLWDEKSVGTNAIGTCLAIDKPMQVIGAEHYCEYHHRWTCSAAPIHNSKGEIIGCFDISGRAEDVQTHTFAIAVSSANCIEKQLAISESYHLVDTTFDSIMDGIMVVDSNLKVIRINNKVKDIFDMEESDILNTKFDKVFKLIDIKNNIFIAKEKMSIFDFTISIGNKKVECSLNISPILAGDEVAAAVIFIREAKHVRKEVSKLAGFNANYTFNSIITEDSKMKELISTAKKVSKTNCPILIEGESGTGKELYAQSIHNESHRRNGPFIAINCSAIPKELFESELFGYESGSFTGAVRGGKPGKFELANGGTIFLDEIGEIPLEVQPKLLRVLDNNKIMRIGSFYERNLDVRVISATNRNLADEISKGSFRQDLYFRLNVINLKIPPLRNRKNDIIVLARYFLEDLNRENSMQKYFSKSFEETLKNHFWSGNVRELKNIIQRAYYTSDRQVINSTVFYKDNAEFIKSSEKSPSFNLKDIEKDSIKQALAANNFNVLRAANDLNISKATIYRKIKMYSIDLRSVGKSV
jgi:transcriptional regulator of acetoin/glycerol metabolism